MQKGGKGKKGLSTVVITLIIILVSLVAIGIIWIAVKNVVQKSSEDIEMGQFTIDASVEVIGINETRNNVSLIVTRNPGKGDFTGVVFLFENITSKEKVEKHFTLYELEAKGFELHLEKLGVTNVTKLSIYPLYRSSSNEFTMGAKTDEYIFTGIEKFLFRPGGGAICGNNIREMWEACDGTDLAGQTCISQGFTSGNLACYPPGDMQECRFNTSQCQGGTCTPSCAGKECGSDGCTGSCGDCSSYGAGYTCNATGRCVLTPSLSCNTSSTTWQNNQITSQNGWFTAVFNSTPYNNSMDGVFGLSQGAQTTYSGFSTLFRFNSSGYIDVFDGNISDYKSLQSVPYTANTKYNFRFIVNITSQRYNVYVTPQGGVQTLLASNFGFRTSATLINNRGLIGSSGTFNICDFNITSSISGPSCTPATCLSRGYECGTNWANGTCSGTFNCEPPNCTTRYGAGYSCNASGRCVNMSGNIINALSCSYTDVSNAINSANTGDTVIVPAGACTWSNALGITKGITLKGAGIGNTVIKWAGGSDNIIVYNPTSPALNEAFRFTGFTLNGNHVSGSIGFYIRNPSDTTTLNKIRIDHCRVINFEEAFSFLGMIYGLVDHNELNGNILAFRLLGDNDYSWNDPLSKGSANYMYIEDNNISNNAEEWTLAGWGARYVFRYNNCDLAGSDYNIFEAHGNLGDASGPYGIARGCVGVEIYENTLTSCATFRLHDHRGGALIMFNNVGTGGSGGGNFPIILREEDDDIGIGPGYPLKTTWPGYDPIKDSYIWGNTINGNPLRCDNWDYGTMILEKTDYWSNLQDNSESYSTYWSSGVFASRPASPANGNCYWATDTRSLYRSVGANNWTLVYQPYIYPHPLTLIP